MKKYMEYSIIFLSVVGILIEVLSSIFEVPFNIMRGILLFRYFTLQSNFLILLSFVLLQTKYKEKIMKFFPGIVSYITITFVVFATMLQGITSPEGIRVVGNLLVHYIVPIMSIIYLVVFIRKTYKYQDILYWMIYPLFYVLFALINGLITNDYIYPFFNINSAGILVYSITVIILIVLFVGLSFIFMKIVSKKELTKN